MKVPKKFLEQAGELLKNGQKAQDVLECSQVLLENQAERLSKIKVDLKSCIRMVKAYIHGDYTEVPWASLLSIMAGIVYFLNPIDLVPDILIGGFFDDVTVLALIFAQFRKDIDAFLVWETSSPKSASSNDADL